jgi:inorganic phosphate transporter, PiT family
MFALLPGLYLGWGIGANDTANTFGAQVGANVISYKRAIALAAAFALLGAVLEGQKVFATLGGLTRLSLDLSVIAALAAGISVNVMTVVGMPVSSSHAIAGALVAAGLLQGRGVHVPTVLKLSSSLIAAPLGAAVIAYMLYRLLLNLSAGRLGTLLIFQQVIRYSAVVVGCYASYALGSNNVGNAVAPFVAVGLIAPAPAALLGGLAIAGGVLTYSKNVIMTVGNNITALDPASALVAAMGTAITTHVFTQLAIPVSTSQAIVGAVIGVGLTKGMMAVNRRVFWMIPASWVLSILSSGAIAYLLLLAYQLIR